LCRKVARDVALVMSSGSEFHNLAATTGKARSPLGWNELDYIELVISDWPRWKLEGRRRRCRGTWSAQRPRRTRCTTSTTALCRRSSSESGWFAVPAERRPPTGRRPSCRRRAPATCSWRWRPTDRWRPGRHWGQARRGTHHHAALYCHHRCRRRRCCDCSLGCSSVLKLHPDMTDITQNFSEWQIFNDVFSSK